MTTTITTAFEAVLATARAAAEAGDTMRARHYFRNATEIDPTSGEAWLGLAAATTVLSEGRGLYERVLAIDPACAEARAAIARIDSLLAAGVLLRPQARQATADHSVAHLPATLPPALDREPPTLPAHAPSRLGCFVAVALSGLLTMGTLTGAGIFVLTSFWGLMLAFIAGPMVSELMLRLTARWRKGPGGRAMQFAGALGMLLGSLGALFLGGLLLSLLGLPLPAEAVAMAHQLNLADDATTVLLNNPGLLVFISSAVAATVYRLR